MKNKFSLCVMAGAIASSLVACGGDSSNNNSSISSVQSSSSSLISSSSSSSSSTAPEVFNGVSLSLLSRYHSDVFGESAAEIPAYHAKSQRIFMVNANKGQLDVISLADVNNPKLENTIASEGLLVGSQVNSVAIHGDYVAIAIEAATKTDLGMVAIYDANTLIKISHIEVGALPDMLTFTPDGRYLLVANEGEPNDDYSIDPEGSVSIIDVSDVKNLTARVASFSSFNNQRAALNAAGVRIYGPNATVVQDVEPEYIAISADGKTAWASLQENNALAHIDIASATVTKITALGEKDYGALGSGIDASDTDKIIDIRPWQGVKGLYLPDAMLSYSVNGQDYLITANEGDARAWGEDNLAYFAGDESQGFVEEFRVKHLVHKDGFKRRVGEDMPAHLGLLGAGALLNPEVFGYCGATAGNPAACRNDEVLGRLNVTWTLGYRQDENGNPVMFTASGEQSETGNRLMYDKLYSYGARSISIWNADGQQVWDSGDFMEKYLASDDCKLGSARTIACKDFFNTGHDEGNAFDSRSDAKGPEPEGLALGYIADTPVVFVGLERMGGVMVFNIANPEAPIFLDYLNTREDFVSEEVSVLGRAVGDLGPEGLVFIAKEDSPTGEPLLVVGNEVSGTTAIYNVSNAAR